MRDVTDLDRRKTGGAGSRSHPLTDEDYRRQKDKLLALNKADAEADE